MPADVKETDPTVEVLAQILEELATQRELLEEIIETLADRLPGY